MENIVTKLSTFDETNHKNETSLLNRINKATSEAEVAALLTIGKKYKKVSIKTMKKWVKAANSKFPGIKL